MHREGATGDAIAEHFGMSLTTVKNYAGGSARARAKEQKGKRTRAPNLTDKQKKDITARIKNGETQVSIAKVFGIAASSVSRYSP